MIRWVKRLLPALCWAVMAHTAAAAPAAADASRRQEAEWVYNVQLGDSLSVLGRRFLSRPGQWRSVQRLNGVSNPDFLPSGMKLRIPVAWLRAVASGATVLGVVGDVFLDRATSPDARRVASGDSLGTGDRLRCGSSGSASIRLDDGSVLRVAPDTQLEFGRLDRLTTTGMFQTRMRVLRGRLESLVAPATGAGSRFEVETPVAVTAVRGTNYRVTAEGASARAEVVEGHVDVGNDLGGVQVAGGFGTVTEQGVAPRPPVPLLPAPDLSSLPARADRIGASLSFGAVPRAQAYRVQFAQDAEFLSVLLDTVSPSPAFVVPDVPDGGYFLRVRAIDPDQLEGLSIDRPVRVDARPLAPTTSRPALKERTRDASPTFAWQAVDGATRYRLQVARDAAFTQPVADVDAGSALEAKLPKPLPPARYHWRVIAADAEGEGPPSATATFRRLSQATAIPPADRHADDAVLDWPAGEAAGYRVQVARDEAFSDLVWSTETRAPPVTIPELAPGRYLARIQPVEEDGEAGDWSAPTAVELRERPVPPPVLSAPDDRAVLDSLPVTLSWNAADRAAGYRLQLATEPTFAKPLADVRIAAGHSYVVDQTLPPGRVFWRVASLGRSTEGAFSDAREWRRLPAVPRIVATQADETSVTARWSAVQVGQSFVMQLSDDAAFSRVLSEQHPADNAATAAVATPGRYFVRVAAVDVDGYTGPFGEPRPVDVPAKAVPKRPPRWPTIVIPLMLLFTLP